MSTSAARKQLENTELPIRIREATEADVAFIFKSWLKTFRQADFATNITKTVYYAEHHKVLEQLLKKQKTLIACNQEDPNQIYGFICADYVDNIFCAHFIYVKHIYRKLGIANMLLNSYDHDPTLASIYTHYNRVSEKAAQKYNMIYHPYTAFKIAYENQEETNEA